MSKKVQEPTWKAPMAKAETSNKKKYGIRLYFTEEINDSMEKTTTLSNIMIN